MNVIKILIKNTFIISFITFIMLETFGFFLSKINVIPSGSPAVISLFADKNFAVWHPKNMKFKHHYNTCWDPSYVTFNNIGARSTKDYYETKTTQICPCYRLSSKKANNSISVGLGNSINF